MAKEPLKLIYADLVNAVATVAERKNIYIGGRPNVINEESVVSSYVVIDLPASVEDIAFGNRRFVLDTAGVIYLFVKGKKDRTLNINATSSLVEKVTGLFPIVGDVCGAANPKVLMRGSDEYGYQVVSITFDLQTKPNAFSD